MDPKTPAHLDPKLKEVYDRVMGTPLTSASTGSPNPPPPPSASPLPDATQPSAATATSQASSPFPPLPKAPLTNPTPPPPPSPSPVGMNPQSSPLSQTMPAPSQPLAAKSPSLSSQTESPTMSQTVDYAALAAKYATPLPTINPAAPVPPAPKPTVVTPSIPTYGVVNNGGHTEAAGQKEKKPLGKKKLLLFLGIPVVIVAYAVIWIVIFHLDVMALLGLSQYI